MTTVGKRAAPKKSPSEELSSCTRAIKTVMFLLRVVGFFMF